MACNVLVTGGAGYIGCHVVKDLLKNNAYNVIVFDNLSSGYADLVQQAKLVVGDLQNSDLLCNVLIQEKITAVMHLAAKTSVPESIADPEIYYDNNTMGTLSLLSACKKAQIPHFIFSSTAAVYGLPTESYVQESSPTAPINPYGHSKLMGEQMIKDFANAYAMKFVILRYFNVAGADPEGKLGQRSKKAEHLIKVALEAACGKRTALPIFGTDYPTPDGTCVRDFIHVSDIAHAHIEALNYLQNKGQSTILNCGYGQGYSVKDVVKTVEKIAGVHLKTENAPRREGDSPSVIATNEKIKKILKWQPQFNDLEFIVKTAYNWEKKAS
ncbi:UDP-glucose 4-epimerase GalE [Candidatus Berkiella cookevillensis]|uniref:UDP-glucose 4-epimerase n=1 Tax=Candidatus Berkiella cookevillensis TaxID=437022 RepID=A0A0Q9YPK6_9GAMM|nr:UDP-glucose 4-epimerase GalE [Candidatus Berkiella cookevillensis]MCS5709112.1 UDP-glucose 4-epimerase GalE [Candidatus Berkiella cookevillensis]